MRLFDREGNEIKIRAGTKIKYRPQDYTISFLDKKVGRLYFRYGCSNDKDDKYILELSSKAQFQHFVIFLSLMSGLLPCYFDTKDDHIWISEFR